MKTMIASILLAFVTVGAVQQAFAYSQCTTSCYGNTCTTSCY
jgi:hypothetical protein